LGAGHRRQPQEAGGELDAEGVGVHVSQGVEEAAGLAADGGDDLGMTVADGGDAESRGEIEVAVAVGVDDVDAARRLPEERRLGAGDDGVDAGGFEAGEAARLGGGARPGRRGEDARRAIAGGAGSHISRRPARERPRVTSSVYSMSPPTGMPK